MSLSKRFWGLDNKPLRGKFALNRFLDAARTLDRQEDTKCIDIGCGDGRHLQAIKESGTFTEVHGLNIAKNAPCVGEDRYFPMPVEQFVQAEDLGHAYDAVWCCHVLEHTLTPGPFLKSIHSLLKENGLLCIIVPPLKQEITVGHVTLWNPGVLLLNLLKAGFDCKNILMKRRGYNIAAILNKKSLPEGIKGEALDFNIGHDLDARPFLPDDLKWIQNPRSKKWLFKGNFRALNW
jgi:SAM-dependent methyltransferase